MGNKCDLDVDRRVQYDDLQDKAGDLKLSSYETSALPDRRATVEELFNDLIVQLA